MEENIAVTVVVILSITAVASFAIALEYEMPQFLIITAAGFLLIGLGFVVSLLKEEE